MKRFSKKELMDFIQSEINLPWIRPPEFYDAMHQIKEELRSPWIKTENKPPQKKDEGVYGRVLTGRIEYEMDASGITDAHNHRSTPGCRGCTFFKVSKVLDACPAII